VIVSLFDYGAGNLHSLTRALELGGASVRLEGDARAALEADALVLPGVGAFGAAAARLAPARAAVRAALAGGLPCLGVCLGMQLLFDGSDEGPGAGLGLIGGRVTRLAARRVPQMGWNTVADADDPLLARAPLDTAYYAHGYACRVADPSVVRAWCTHDGDRFPAIVRAGYTVGVQFHPEKSGRDGVAFVRAFLDEARAARRNGAAS
jgi:imidazole glycerol-phosphate synthase subunit HisH